MKKYISGLLLVVSLFIGINSLDALMITLDELKEEGTFALSETEEVVDNVYVVGEYIFTNYLDAARLALAGSDEVYRFDTARNEWSYLGEDENVDMSKVENLVVTSKNGEVVTIDYIHNSEELRYAVSEENELATTLVLAEDIIINDSSSFMYIPNNVSYYYAFGRMGIYLTRSLTIDFNGHTIGVGDDEFYLDRLAPKLLFMVNNEDESEDALITFKDFNVTGVSYGVAITDSEVAFTGTTNVSGVKDVGIAVEYDGVADLSETTIVNDNETIETATLLAYGVDAEEIDEVIVFGDNELFSYSPTNYYTIFNLNKDNTLFATLSIERYYDEADAIAPGFTIYADGELNITKDFTDKELSVVITDVSEGLVIQQYLCEDEEEENCAYTELEIGEDPYVIDKEIDVTENVYSAMYDFKPLPTTVGEKSFTLSLVDEDGEVYATDTLTINVEDPAFYQYYVDNYYYYYYFYNSKDNITPIVEVDEETGEFILDEPPYYYNEIYSEVLTTEEFAAKIGLEVVAPTTDAKWAFYYYDGEDWVVLEDNYMDLEFNESSETSYWAEGYYALITDTKGLYLITSTLYEVTTEDDPETDENEEVLEKISDSTIEVKAYDLTDEGKEFLENYTPEVS